MSGARVVEVAAAAKQQQQLKQGALSDREEGRHRVGTADR